MARGKDKKVGRSSGGGEGRKETGIEKYGKDQVDEYLNLSDGDEVSEAESDVCEEEDVMELEAGDDEEEDYVPPPKASTNAKKSKASTEDSDGKGLEAASKGWHRNEFYGGDDAGDDSDVNSDEDLVFEEAKRLEELRALQLTGGEDSLAALLAKPADGEEPALADTLAGSAPGSLAANAQFESVFAGEAEKVSVRHDLSELSASERKGLIKKEAPELLPLLSDFKAKLAGLQELLPLLRPAVLKKLPASGAAYLEAKAALLLNTLANLSFYLVLRAEGESVRAHPVIPQLVWLRELHEQISPLDETLSKKVQKATVAAKHAMKAGLLGEAGANSGAAQQRSPAISQPEHGGRSAAPRKKTLRERMERLQVQQPAPASGKASQKKQIGEGPLSAKLSHGLKDLLKLPKSRPAANSGSADAPADLDDIDPTLGVWAPKSSVAEELSGVNQQLRAHAVRAQAAKGSADQNPEARKRVGKERGLKVPGPEEVRAEEAPAEIAGNDEQEDHDLIKDAYRVAKSKKDRKSMAEAQRAEAKENARRLKEFRPEEVADGRRKTSKRILENRGLSRIRKKHAGNARVSNKNKYEKAVKRRKGAVQEMRQGEGDGATYDGEATGIRTHVKKSQKLG